MFSNLVKPVKVSNNSINIQMKIVHFDLVFWTTGRSGFFYFLILIVSQDWNHNSLQQKYTAFQSRKAA